MTIEKERPVEAQAFLESLIGPMTLGKFLAAIRDANLLPASRLTELTAWLAQSKADAQELAKELNRRGWMTPYQIKEIYKGRGRELTLGPYLLLDLIGEELKVHAKAAAKNKSVRSTVKTAVKKVVEAVAAGDKTAATAGLQAANRELDRAASKGVIHKNQAANRKSGLATSVAKLKD
jgi:small subunit ribosomal protein S20